MSVRENSMISLSADWWEIKSLSPTFFFSPSSEHFGKTHKKFYETSKDMAGSLFNITDVMGLFASL